MESLQPTKESLPMEPGSYKQGGSAISSLSSLQFVADNHIGNFVAILGCEFEFGSVPSGCHPAVNSKSK